MYQDYPLALKTWYTYSTFFRSSFFVQNKYAASKHPKGSWRNSSTETKSVKIELQNGIVQWKYDI